MSNKFIRNLIASVIVVLFTFFGAYAYAEDKSGPIESEFGGILQYNICIKSDNEGSTDYSIISDSKSKAEIKLYNTKKIEIKPEDVKTFKDLSKLVLCIEPPEEKAVYGIYIFSGDCSTFEDNELNIVPLCKGTIDSAALELDLSLITHDYFIKSDDDTYDKVYKLAILFEDIPDIINYEYIFDDTGFEPEFFSLEEPFSGEFSDSFKLPEIDTEIENSLIKESAFRFDGWIITYDNASSISISPDEFEDFSPYMSFKAIPYADNDIVVLIINDKEYTFDGVIPSGDTYEFASEIPESTHQDYKLICNSKKIKPLGFTAELSELTETDGIFTASINAKNIKLLIDGKETNIELTEEAPEYIYIYPATFSLKKSPLTITAKSITEKYNGSPFTCPEIEAPEGLIGDNILDYSKISVTGSRIDIGSSINNAYGALVLSDSSDNAVDVSMFYDITYVPGQITVTKPDIRNITISPSSEKIEKLYRGEGLTPDTSGSSFYSVSGELYPTDSLAVHSSLYYSPIYDEGIFYYAISDCTILRNNLPLNNPYDYYNIILDNNNYGQLQVSKNYILITADSFTKQYDGTAVSKNGYSLTGKLYEGDQAVINVTPAQSINKVGTTENIVYSCSVTDAQGRDVSDYYSIDKQSGILEITPKQITITVNDVQKEYNGEYQSISGYNDITMSASLPNSPDKKYRFEMSLEPVGAIKEIGSATVSVAVKKIYTFDTVVNSQLEDVTDQFSISVIPGKLTIIPRVLTIKTKSLSSPYTGNTLSDSSAPEVTGKLAGDKITVKYTGVQTKIGSSDNSCTVTGIVDTNGMDVMKNYSIHYSFGKLTVYSSSNSTSTPLTGDVNHPILYITLSIMALFGFCSIYHIYRKTEQNQYKGDKL